MEIPEDLYCLFSGSIERTRGGDYRIEVPEREIQLGQLDTGTKYRIALICTDEIGQQPETNAQPERNDPPVESGELRTVEIDHLGDQGDGIAKVENDFVVIVPDIDVGERVQVRIESVEDSYAFGEPINL